MRGNFQFSGAKYYWFLFVAPGQDKDSTIDIGVFTLLKRGVERVYNFLVLGEPWVVNT